MRKCFCIFSQFFFLCGELGGRSFFAPCGGGLFCFAKCGLRRVTFTARAAGTPYSTSFPFFPGKERKLTGEASSAEESEGLGIFPDAASSGGLHRLAMLATAFLASEKIPMSPSDNGRRGLTLQEKETAARAKFAAAQGRRRSDLPMLTSPIRANFTS